MNELNETPKRKKDAAVTFMLSDGLNIRCCDCGLVHTVRKSGRPVKVTFTRNEQATRQTRMGKINNIVRVMDDAISLALAGRGQKDAIL